MKYILHIVLVGFCFLPYFGFTQSETIDSLKKVIRETDIDTVRVNAYVAWDNLVYRSDPELDEELNQKISEICFENLASQSSNREQVFFQKSLATAKNNLGIIAHERGDFETARNNYFEALELWELLEDEKQQAAILSNVGVIYVELKNYERADHFHQKALKIREKTNDKRGIGISLNNLGALYKESGDDSKALGYFIRSLEIREEIDDKAGQGSSLNNIGALYLRMDELETALDYCQRGLTIREEIGSKKGIASSKLNIANIYRAMNNSKKALGIALEIKEISDDLGNVKLQRDAEGLLYNCYKELGRSNEALVSYEKYIIYRDSIVSAEFQDELMRQEINADYEVIMAADSVKRAEEKKVTDALIAAQDAEIEKNQIQRYALWGGVSILILFGLFMYSRFRVSNKQKKIIETQKNEVESQKEIIETSHQEIKASISYAKRIQSAILPPDETIDRTLPNSFVLYKPKDIVAGDFYWLEEKEDKVLFAVADCTGHGVPGAMVSVFCNNGLNRSVREHGLTDPGKILDKTREIVVAEFEKSDDEVKDGMDIALCALKTEDEGRNILQYAGAHNPLWIIRRGATEVEEITANKQPIGKFDKSEPYKTHQVELTVGDTVYIFSDGFADQFGGISGKKFKSSHLKELLLSIQNESMTNQKQMIHDAFNKWKGHNDQVDDVCILGIRI